VAPASVQAAEVYGFINTTFESSSTDNGGNFAIFSTNGDDSGGGFSDTAESRFGVTGSEDLGNGLTAGYTFEFGIGTSSSFAGRGGSNPTNTTFQSFGGGSPNEDSTVNTRLANVSLSGDWGQVKVGTQWGVLYSYAGWNHYRSDGHGGATHYYMLSNFVGPFSTGEFSSGTGDSSGLRISNALTYTYGGGGYSSDPFTFSVQLQSDGNGETNFQAANSIDDEETIDTIILGAQSTFGDFTVNGTYYQENNTSTSTMNIPEPSLLTLGGRWSSGPFYVGGTYFAGDTDIGGTLAADDPDSPSAINVLAGMDFGSGYSGYVGVGSGDADRGDGDGDLTTYFLQAQKTFSSRTKIYGEFENAEIEGVGTGGNDAEQQVLAVGLKHSF
jgi:predicted porin